MFTWWWAALGGMWCLWWAAELRSLWHVMFSLRWAALTGMWCLWWVTLHGMWCLLYDEQHSVACDAYFMMISAWHCTWEFYAYFQTGHSVNDYIPSLFIFFNLLLTWILLTASAVILSFFILEGWYQLADIEKCVKLLELCSSTCLFDFFIFFGVYCAEDAKVKFF
jgi:hypothetical protein